MNPAVRIASALVAAVAAALPAFALAQAAKPLGADVLSAVPQDIRTRGTIRVGSQQTFPPVEFREPGKTEVIGVSRDLLDEVAKRLNLKIEYIQAEYAALIPGIEANRFDVASGGISDTEEREQKLDFVNYMVSGGSLLALETNTDKLTTIDDFCGKSIATMLGSRTIMSAVEAASERCKKAGKPEIRADQLPSAPDARMQVDLKRVDAYIGDLPALAYIRTQFPGKYKIVGGNYILTPYITSWGYAKSASGLRDGMQKALQSMLDDGSYKQVLDKWEMGGGALPKITVNLPSSKR